MDRRLSHTSVNVQRAKCGGVQRLSFNKFQFQGQVFYLETFSRLLDVFNRYSIDLLLVCEATELLNAHAKRVRKAMSEGVAKKSNDDAATEKSLRTPPKLPNYLQTTFVDCAGASRLYVIG